MTDVTTRRAFLGSGIATAAGYALLPRVGVTQPAPQTVTRVIDLSHTIGTATQPAFSMEATRTYDSDQMNINRWTLSEHGGTHLEAPLHFTPGGASMESIPAADLVAPLVVIDIARRAAAAPDTAVTPADIRAWEAGHGVTPQGCCVVMHSGWGRKFGTPGYGGRGADGRSRLPGFHIDTVRFLLAERSVKGIGVDTASIDPASENGRYPAHKTWLAAGRWGLEGLNNLDLVPARGATIIVGALNVTGATGSPARIMALI